MQCDDSGPLLDILICFKIEGGMYMMQVRCTYEVGKRPSRTTFLEIDGVFAMKVDFILIVIPLLGWDKRRDFDDLCILAGYKILHFLF